MKWPVAAFWWGFMIGGLVVTVLIGVAALWWEERGKWRYGSKFRHERVPRHIQNVRYPGVGRRDKWE